MKNVNVFLEDKSKILLVPEKIAKLHTKGGALFRDPKIIWFQKETADEMCVNEYYDSYYFEKIDEENYIGRRSDF